MYIPVQYNVVRKSLLLLSGGVLFYWISSGVYGLIMRRRFSARRARKQLANVRAKTDFAEYLRQNPMTDEQISEITSKPYLELVNELRSNDLSPEKALRAYQHKAFQVDRRCNCVTEFLYPDLSEVNLNGPFAGAPVSLKDDVCVKGCESHAGMAYFLTGEAKEDAVIVTVLKSLGAVPFVRTNVPQSLLSVLSRNPIDGVTLNPLDPSRSPAGSSSGEAALIGGGGSGLGFGTDLGGSVRLPAAMCNIVGFKPTHCRLSQRRMFKISRFMTIPSCCGLLARDTETCVMAMRALCNSVLHHELDQFNPPLTFSDKIPTDRPLKIGYFTYDGSFCPVAAAQRAVMHVKEKLEAMGHQLIFWSPPYLGHEWLMLFLTGVCVDNDKRLAKMLQYDVVEPTIAPALKLYKSGWLYRYLHMMWTKLFGNPENVYFLRALLSVYDIPSLAQYTCDLKAFRQRIYDHWNDAHLDALICPAFGMAAPVPANTTRKFTGMLSYLNLFNLTLMPAGCLPSGIRVSEDDLASLRSSDYATRSEWHKAAFDLQQESLGFPVSVQVAAAPWRDELCLYVMGLVEQAVRS